MVPSGTENQDSPPNLSKIAETHASKARQGSCNKEKRANGGQTTKRLKPGDIVRMKPDPKDRKKLSKKATCRQENATRSNDVDIEGTRYRTNRNDLIATQEGPAIEGGATSDG